MGKMTEKLYRLKSKAFLKRVLDEFGSMSDLDMGTEPTGTHHIENGKIVPGGSMPPSRYYLGNSKGRLLQEIYDFLNTTINIENQP